MTKGDTYEQSDELAQGNAMTTRTCEHCHGSLTVPAFDGIALPCVFCDPENAQLMLHAIYRTWAKIRDALTEVRPAWASLAAGSMDAGDAGASVIAHLARTGPLH